MTQGDHIIYALLWLSFGAAHSVLASGPTKRLLHDVVGAGYRLAYNLVAALHIGFVIYGGRALLANHAYEFEFPNNMVLGLNAIAGLGLIIFLAALLQYDLGLFSGIKQVLLRAAERSQDAIEPLQTSGMNGFVRHPLYSGAYLWLWATVRTEFDLATAIWASAYLMIGTQFEERRLLKLYGEDYARYRRHVPAVIPWRGRAFTKMR